MDRFVISQRATGWGDCFVSLVSAWHYARRTRRTLVIDGRRSCYVDDPRRNAFPAYFEPVTAIADVPIVSDEAVGERTYPPPIHIGFGHLALRGGGKRFFNRARGWLLLFGRCRGSWFFPGSRAPA